MWSVGFTQGHGPHKTVVRGGRPLVYRHKWMAEAIRDKYFPTMTVLEIDRLSRRTN